MDGLCNAGAFTDISPATMGRLADLEGVAAIKDTRPDFEGHLKNLMAVRGKACTILCGGEYLVGPGLLFGADGNISGASNLFPKLFVDLYNAARSCDAATVRQLSERIARIHAITQMPGASWLAVFKYIGSRLGLMQPWCCRPYAPLNEVQRRRVDELLSQMET